MLGVQAIDVVDLRRANVVLAAAVARDGVPLYEDQRGRFNQFVSLAMRRFADTRKFRLAEAANSVSSPNRATSRHDRALRRAGAT